MKIDWNQIVKDIEQQILELAQEIFKAYAKEATEDAKMFLVSSKEKLQRWSKLLANGDLDEDEYKSLVKGQLDVAELHALKAAGLAQVKIDMFIQGLVKILTAAVLTAAKGVV